MSYRRLTHSNLDLKPLQGRATGLGVLPHRPLWWDCSCLPVAALAAGPPSACEGCPGGLPTDAGPLPEGVGAVLPQLPCRFDHRPEGPLTAASLALRMRPTGRTEGLEGPSSWSATGRVVLARWCR